VSNPTSPAFADPYADWPKFPNRPALETMFDDASRRPTVFLLLAHQRRRRGQQRERAVRLLAITCSSSRDWL